MNWERLHFPCRKCLPLMGTLVFVIGVMWYLNSTQINNHCENWSICQVLKVSICQVLKKIQKSRKLIRFKMGENDKNSNDHRNLRLRK